jgi:hypothetical protein
LPCPQNCLLANPEGTPAANVSSTAATARSRLPACPRPCLQTHARGLILPIKHTCTVQMHGSSPRIAEACGVPFFKTPGEPFRTQICEYNEELSKAGVLLALDGLHPSSKGARVKFSGKSRTVIDGPFTEAKELIAGFTILQVKSLEEAIEWVKRAPNCNPAGDSEVEIRQIFEMEDFAPVLTEEQIQHKVAKRAALPNQTAGK